MLAFQPINSLWTLKSRCSKILTFNLIDFFQTSWRDVTWEERGWIYFALNKRSFSWPQQQRRLICRHGNIVFKKSIGKEVVVIKLFIALSMIMIASSSYALELHNATILKHRAWIDGKNFKGAALTGHLENKSILLSSSSTVRARTYQETHYLVKDSGTSKSPKSTR